MIAFGFSTALAPAVFFLALAGGADAVSGIFRMTMWNQTIPDALRGRMAGIEMLGYMSGPLLGHVEAGVVAGAFGVRASVISGGVFCVLGVGLAALFLPRFVRYDARRARFEGRGAGRAPRFEGLTASFHRNAQQLDRRLAVAVDRHDDVHVREADGREVRDLGDSAGGGADEAGPLCPKAFDPMKNEWPAAWPLGENISTTRMPVATVNTGWVVGGRSAGSPSDRGR